jgi:hypothetical protein
MVARWEHRCFLRHDGDSSLTVAALRLADVATDAMAEEREDTYFALDADHGLKRRAGGVLELKRTCKRQASGVELLHKTQVTANRFGLLVDDATGAPLPAATAAAVEAALARAPVVVAKRRRRGRAAGGVSVEVVELNVRAQHWLSLCAESDDAGAATTAGALLLSAVLAAAQTPPSACVCSYARWVCHVAAADAPGTPGSSAAHKSPARV